MFHALDLPRLVQLNYLDYDVLCESTIFEGDNGRGNQAGDGKVK